MQNGEKPNPKKEASPKEEQILYRAIMANQTGIDRLLTRPYDRQTEVTRRRIAARKGNRLKLRTVKNRQLNTLWDISRAKSPMYCYRTKFNTTPKPPIEGKTKRYIDRVYRTMIPIVKIERSDLNKQISPHFKVRELVRIDPNDREKMQANGTWSKFTRYMYEYPKGSEEFYWKYARIDPNMVRALEAVRKLAGFNISINEGVRPFLYNKAMYSASNQPSKSGSAHIYGKAVDINRTGNPKKDKILLDAITQVLDGKGGGIGTYGRDKAIHMDINLTPKTSTKPGSWTIKNGKAVLRTRTW